MDSEMTRVVDVIGENVDHLCQLELRCRGYAHGVVHNLYRAAREKTGEPLALAAAKRLHQSVGRGDVVLLATGAGNPLFLPAGETDGPLGTTALARMLAEALGAVPILLTEEPYMENLSATATATGLGIRSLEHVRQVPYTTTVLSFPAEELEAKKRAAELIDTLTPKAVITIEKIGPNAAGVSHSATGMEMGPERAQVEHLVNLARERGILTIGIGDNGNEIGYGLIQEAVWQHKMFGRECQCPCGQGLATAVATDILVVASISNWGAYGIEACLAALVSKPQLIHSQRMEQFMLESNVRTGGVDGSTYRQILQVDATSMEVQLAFNELLRGVVHYGFLDPSTRRPYKMTEE